MVYRLWVAILLALVSGSAFSGATAQDLQLVGVTQSGLSVEVVDAQAMCSSVCVSDPPSGSSRSFPNYVSYAMTLRITNQSEKDPKLVRPCNLAIFSSDEELNGEDLEDDEFNNYMLRWRLIDGSQINIVEVEGDSLESAREMNACAQVYGWEGEELPLDIGKSMTITICQTNGAARTQSRESGAAVLYLGDLDFRIEAPISLTDHQEDGGEFNRIYGDVCETFI